MRLRRLLLLTLLVAVTGIGLVTGRVGPARAAMPTLALISPGPRDQAGTLALGAYTIGTGAGPMGVGILGVLHLQPTSRDGSTILRLASARLTDVAATALTPITQDATLVFTTSPQSQLFLPLVRR